MGIGNSLFSKVDSGYDERDATFTAINMQSCFCILAGEWYANI